MTTPENHIYATARAAAAALTHAEGLGLPAPFIVRFDNVDQVVGVHFERYDDLAAWSTYAETPIESRATKAGTIHHNLGATILELEISAVYIEPAPTPVEEYHCGRCGDRFGIAGQNTGTPGDHDADAYFEAEVRRHETGECTPADSPALVTEGCSQ